MHALLQARSSERNYALDTAPANEYDVSRKLEAMKSLSFAELLSAVARGCGRPCIYLSGLSMDPECLKAAPFLKPSDQILFDGSGVIVCEDEAEARRLFGLVVGDDGPTPTNPYAGEYKVYALWCDAAGDLRSENT